MHDPRLGAAFRAVRIKRGWRQSDVAERAGSSRSVVSQVERGDIGRLQVDTLERIANVLEIHVRLTTRWRGGDLDRLVSGRHSALQDAVIHHVASVHGWRVAPEVSFAYYGERGIIDILAWHVPTRSLLVIEIKTELVDVSETLGTLDRKRRLAVKVAAERGWRADTVSLWLIVAAGSTNRRRVSAHRSLFRAALPGSGHTMRSWLHAPTGAVAALSLWSISLPDGTRRNLASPKRVRRTSTPAVHS